jgi:hypothetical protein
MKKRGTEKAGEMEPTSASLDRSAENGISQNQKPSAEPSVEA